MMDFSKRVGERKHRALSRVAPHSATRAPDACRASGVALWTVAAASLALAACVQPVKVGEKKSSTTMGPAVQAGAGSEPPQTAQSEIAGKDAGCEPSCKGRACGDDGCGGRCGECPPRQLCNEPSGECAACQGPACGVCVPDCDRRSCGEDGCGGTCGDCDAGEFCSPQGRCRLPVCGNGVIEGNEECDGGDLCTAACVALTREQSACLIGSSAAEGECRECGCLKCTTEIANCYLTGDPTRDAACRTIGECGVKNRCGTLDECICGPGMCRPPNGPCLDAANRAIGMAEIGIFEIRACFDDPECALYRANAFGACIAEKCNDVCLESPPATPMDP